MRYRYIRKMYTRIRIVHLYVQFSDSSECFLCTLYTVHNILSSIFVSSYISSELETIIGHHDTAVSRKNREKRTSRAVFAFLGVCESVCVCVFTWNDIISNSEVSVNSYDIYRGYTIALLCNRKPANSTAFIVTLLPTMLSHRSSDRNSLTLYMVPLEF